MWLCKVFNSFDPLSIRLDSQVNYREIHNSVYWSFFAGNVGFPFFLVYNKRKAVFLWQPSIIYKPWIDKHYLLREIGYSIYIWNISVKYTSVQQLTKTIILAICTSRYMYNWSRKQQLPNKKGTLLAAAPACPQFTQFYYSNFSFDNLV